MRLPDVPVQLQNLVDDYHTHIVPEHQLQSHTSLLHIA